MEDQPTIVIVGSDERELSLVARCVEEAGHTAILADDMKSGFREIYNYHPDAVVLMMRTIGPDCWSAIERLRELCDIPTVLITPNARQSDIQRAFDLGIDAYIPAPFRQSEVLGRLAALINGGRSSRQGAPGRNANEQPIFRQGSLTVDWRKMEARVCGQVVHFTATEFRLLSLLIRRRGWVVPYETILAEVWGPNYVGDRNNVKLYIWYLRRKIEQDPAHPRWIITRHGLGYMFSTDEPAEAGDLHEETSSHHVSGARAHPVTHRGRRVGTRRNSPTSPRQPAVG